MAKKENQSCADKQSLFEPRLILIGSAGRNSGKTTLASALIRRFRQSVPVTALKITGIEKHGEACPRGGEGCGACSLPGRNYILMREDNAFGKKDTSTLLAAGAEPVYWLRCLRSALTDGFAEFRQKVPPRSIIICESNSLREIVIPAVFIMIDGETIKPSARRVANLADITLKTPWNAEKEGAVFHLIEERGIPSLLF